MGLLLKTVCIYPHYIIIVDSDFRGEQLLCMDSLQVNEAHIQHDKVGHINAISCITGQGDTPH